MKSEFRKISRVPGLGGGTKWYLSEDCLLAAKRIMYAVEYRRFYLRDLESIAVWPNKLWPVRIIVPAVLLAAIGGLIWALSNQTIAEIFFGLALAWVAIEFAAGPTARSRIRSTGATVDLPIVKRTRRARKVLEKIDEAVRAARNAAGQPLPSPVAAVEPSEISSRSAVDVPSTGSLLGDAAPTSGS